MLTNMFGVCVCVCDCVQYVTGHYFLELQSELQEDGGTHHTSYAWPFTTGNQMCPIVAC